MAFSKNRSVSIAQFAIDHAGKLILGTIILSLLLAFPLLMMANDEQASSDPVSKSLSLQKELDETFPSPIWAISFIAEAKDGDILTQRELWELYKNTQKLRIADETGNISPTNEKIKDFFFKYYSPLSNREVKGIQTIADLVQEFLLNSENNKSLETATDDEVKLAIHKILQNEQTSGMVNLFSIEATNFQKIVNGESITIWKSPAIVIYTLADNEKLGGGSLSIGIDGGAIELEKQQFNRNVQSLLRGNQDSYQLWGVAIDVNLESVDEGEQVGPFIMAAVVVAIILVGLALRSYWAMALTGAGLGILMIWLKGISNLIGLKGGLIIELIVPIAMIALGVDFAMHAMRRYQEESSKGNAPKKSFLLGITGIFGALSLAMISDTIAFFSNLSSKIEAVIHFGSAAGIAIISSFIVLGIIAPLALMKIDTIFGEINHHSKSLSQNIFKLFGGLVAATLFGSSIVILITLDPLIGLISIATSTLFCIVVPVFFLQRRYANTPINSSLDEEKTQARFTNTLRIPLLDSLVVRIAQKAPIVVIVSLIITGISIFYGLKLEPTFAVKDFFDNKSDLVISLDKFEQHVASRGGEPAVVFLKGNLTEPESLLIMDQFINLISNSPFLGKDYYGNLNIQPTILDYVTQITKSDYALKQVNEQFGILITDQNNDGIPDTKEQIQAELAYALLNGIPENASTLTTTNTQVQERFAISEKDSSEQISYIQVFIPGTQEQSIISKAQENLEQHLSLFNNNSNFKVIGLTGSPFVRKAQLDATTKSFQTSLPIAIIATFIVLSVAMRSFRYAAITVIPIILIVAWLYGFMYLGDFSLNFVTAMIGAISIGIGIDYSIYMTERFRQELKLSNIKIEAIRKATHGAGTALVASAVSSIAGFSILYFAPMPIFSAYGLLTAVMIFFALTVSIIVLPSLLMLGTPKIK